MLTQSSLQLPATGRSRFSKALPAVPGLEDAPPPPPPSKSQTQSQTQSQLPLPPPPRKDSLAKPKSLVSSLPATPKPQHKPLPEPVSDSQARAQPQNLPHILAKSPPSGPPKMAIPRRPVGKALPKAAPSLTSSQVKSSTELAPPQSAISSKVQPQLPTNPPSPSESLSSLLSAYSRSSTDSVIKSPDEGTSAHEMRADPSSLEDVPPLTASTSVAMTPMPPTASSSGSSRKPVVDGKLPPPPPSKDRDAARPVSPPTRHERTDSDLAKPSPPRPEIWRRRSLKDIQLPELKLDYSHGSTAASTQAQSQYTPEPAATEASDASQPAPPPPPKSTNRGLPGKDIRPVARQVGQAESQTMGAVSSKAKDLKNKLVSSHHKQGSNASTRKEYTARPSPNRPPTPEYRKEDIKTPIVDTFISPVSPASSPELNSEPSHFTKELPPEPPKEVAVPKTQPTENKTKPPFAADLHSAKSLPDLRARAPSVPTAPLPTGLPKSSSGRDSLASEAASNRTRDSADTSRFPPRRSSAKPETQRLVAQGRNSGLDGDPRLVRSDSQGLCYRGRDGTLYPEMKSTQEPDPKATRFPQQSDDLLPEGTVFQAPPIGETHLQCFQKHRAMNKRPNKHYPLTCQTCEKSDTEDRWVCMFCHLRICDPCLQGLSAHGRDLNLLMKELSGSGTLSLSSDARPGSALGLRLS